MCVDEQVMVRWGELMASLEKRGKPMPIIDSLIAALVVQNDCCLVTRNEKDFKNVDMKICNPWKG